MKTFQHSTTMHLDKRMREVIRQVGAPGYGAYFQILEMLCNETDVKLSIADDGDKELLAEDLGLNSTKDLLDIIEALASVNLLSPKEWHKSQSLFSPDLFEEYEAWQRNTSDVYRKHRNFVFKRDGYRCKYCGSTNELSLDHVLPQSRGGSHEPENLVCCCKRCNSSKHAKTPDEWLGNN